MRPVFASLIAAFLLLPAIPAQEAAKPAATLVSKLEAVLNRPVYQHAHWGLLVVEQDSGKVLFERDADKLFAPASVTKLFTVAAALAEFGPDHRWTTPVVRRGELREDGVLAGDLILLASGDLTMGGRTAADGSISFTNIDHTYANGSTEGGTTPENPLAGLAELAKQVAAAGVKQVRGDVLVDDRLFDKSESSGSGPVRVTPVLVNDNLLDLRITPTEAGQPAKVEWRPRTSAISLDARIETGPAASITRVTATQPAPGRFVVRGVIPAGHKPLLRVVEVDDPAAFARSLFIDCLREAGVRVDASNLVGNRVEALPAREETLKLPRVAAFTSPPFREEAKLILKVSHNLHASTLPLLIASKHGERTLAAGMLRVGKFLREAGVPAHTISFGGGAGGARSDFTTPRATVALLRHMATRPDAAVYQQALPILGVDGTLHDVVPPESPVRGKVQAKTGTFTWQNGLNGRQLLISKALAGYLTTASGKKLVFCFFVNGTHLTLPTDTKREGRALGQLCEIIHLDQ